jgi:deoxycytidylate deaminase
MAVVSKGGKTLSIGFNRPQPVPKRNVHAEHNALSGLRDIQGAEIYVTRLAQGNLTMAMPCEKCMKLIISKGIRKVHFTDYKGEWRIIKL